MTALATLSDHSDLPLWTGRQWLLVLTALTVAGIIIAAYCRRRNARPAHGDHAGAGRRPTCDTTSCRYPGTVLVVESADLGGEARVVCVGCADEGEAHGWWEHVGRVAS